MEEISIIGPTKGNIVITVVATHPDLGINKWYIRVEGGSYAYCLSCTIATTFSSVSEAEEFLENNKTIFKPIVGWSLQSFSIEMITTKVIKLFQD